MTVYVDDVFIHATVPSVRSNAVWCHLMADTELELKEFASTVQISQSWIQDSGRPGRTHFDVTKSVRAKCIAAGAVSLPWRLMGDLMAAVKFIHECENDPSYGSLSSSLDDCFGCGETTVVVGPLCDAANEDMDLCVDCIKQSQDA